jgi:hypothetical protein
LAVELHADAGERLITSEDRSLGRKTVIGCKGSKPVRAEVPERPAHLPAHTAALHETANSASSATKRFGAMRWGEWLPSSWIESLAPGVCRCTQ